MPSSLDVGSLKIEGVLKGFDSIYKKQLTSFTPYFETLSSGEQHSQHHSYSLPAEKKCRIFPSRWEPMMIREEVRLASLAPSNRWFVFAFSCGDLLRPWGNTILSCSSTKVVVVVVVLSSSRKPTTKYALHKTSISSSLFTVVVLSY